MDAYKTHMKSLSPFIKHNRISEVSISCRPPFGKQKIAFATIAIQN